MDVQQAEEELRRRLDRYPADRYPVQHATARFHLGVTRAGAGRLDEAEADLAAACELFAPDRLPVEHAKAANARGAVLRLLGRHDEAAEAFVDAAAVFEGAGLTLEQGAALFNLGLVERERGGAGATDALARARRLLDPAHVPAQAAAASRELGAALLTDGRPDDAVPLLAEAVELANRAGDSAGAGGASNVLGLAHLAAGRPDAAAAALEQAAVASPRSLRPDGWAMAKANLALAEEARGRPHHARLAALCAEATPGAAASVRAQAADVLARLGREPGAVWPVLDSVPAERWPAVVREELHRWVDGDQASCAAEAAAWARNQLTRAAAEDLAECLLAIVVELPPPAADTVVRAVVGAAASGLDDGERPRFVAQCSRAMARFPVPQLMRLEDRFATASAELGLDAGW